jgi:hypothetical protein
MVAEGFTAAEDFTGERSTVEGSTVEGSMVEGSTAAISAGIATLPEVTTAGTVVAAAITGTEVVGMVALTTAADIGTETRIGGGITRSDSGTMITITNWICPTTWMMR